MYNDKSYTNIQLRFPILCHSWTEQEHTHSHTKVTGHRIAIFWNEIKDNERKI